VYENPLPCDAPVADEAAGALAAGAARRTGAGAGLSLGGYSEAGAAGTAAGGGLSIVERCEGVAGSSNSEICASENPAQVRISAAVSSALATRTQAASRILAAIATAS